MTFCQAQSSESRLLGVKWNNWGRRHVGLIAVQLPESGDKPTKRGVLPKLAKVYDPPGLPSPTTLQGKQIFHEICDSKAPWSHLSQMISEWSSKGGKILCQRSDYFKAHSTLSRSSWWSSAPRVRRCLDLWNRSRRLLRRASWSERRNHSNSGDSRREIWQHAH